MELEKNTLPESQLMRFYAVRLLVLCLVLACLVIIPMRVIGHGYMPGDDAMRHAGKVISGKDWDAILVIRDLRIKI